MQFKDRKLHIKLEGKPPNPVVNSLSTAIHIQSTEIFQKPAVTITESPAGIGFRGKRGVGKKDNRKNLVVKWEKVLFCVNYFNIDPIH